MEKKEVIEMIKSMQRTASLLNLTNKSDYAIWLDLNRNINGLLNWLNSYYA